MTVKNNYSIRKPINSPKPSEKLAEFIGIFLGDGSFCSRYQITVSYNYRNESAYAKHIERLISALFGLKARHRIRKKLGAADLVISSSNLVDFLSSNLRIKNIREKNKFVLPCWVNNNRKYKIGFIRGLFDAEGCVYKHSYISNNKNYSYIKIAITNYLPKLLIILKKLLRQTGFHPKVYNNRLHLYENDEAVRFFKIIGTNNEKNKSRLRSFIGGVAERPIAAPC